MCIIIHKPAGADFEERLLKAAYEHNPHGCGVMYAKDGRIHFEKGLVKDFDEALALWTKYKEHEFVFHCRYSTRGKVTDENCHPFQILNKEEHGRDLFMMHNGTLANVPSGDESDSFNFVKMYLTPMLAKRTEFLQTKEFQDFLTLTVGSNNRILFMDGDGKIVIINKEKGEEMQGCWLSNTYSLQPRKTYPAQHHGRASYAPYWGREEVPVNRSRTGALYSPYPRSTAWQPTAESAMHRENGTNAGAQEWDEELEQFFPSKSPHRLVQVSNPETGKKIQSGIDAFTNLINDPNLDLRDVDLGLCAIGSKINMEA